MARIRTIKPEYFTCAQLAQVDLGARLLFVGLWVFGDDQGVHPNDPLQLKMEIFPGDDISAEQVKRWIDSLHAVGLIEVYKAQDRKWIWVPTFCQHQTIRKPRCKYPPPPELVRDQCGTGAELVPHQGETGPSHSASASASASARQEEASASSGDGAPVLYFAVRDSTTPWGLTSEKFAEYQASYPSLDLNSEFRRIAQWCRDNPQKRKTSRGMPRFLNGWLSKTSENRTSEGPTDAEVMADFHKRGEQDGQD